MKIYFSGDSGYGKHIKQIGRDYGPFDISLIDCGQYNEAWKHSHMFPHEAILAAKAGATFVSPFVGRLDDIGQNGLDLIYDIVEIYNNYNYKTQVLVASIRGVNHVIESAKIGADVVTIPTKTFKEMFNHPLTDKGLKAFLSDWQDTGQSIL